MLRECRPLSFKAPRGPHQMRASSVVKSASRLVTLLSRPLDQTFCHRKKNWFFSAEVRPYEFISGWVSARGIFGWFSAISGWSFILGGGGARCCRRRRHGRISFSADFRLSHNIKFGGHIRRLRGLLLSTCRGSSWPFHNVHDITRTFRFTLFSKCKQEGQHSRTTL